MNSPQNKVMTSKETDEVSSSITIAKILAAGNLSDCQDYLMDRFLEAECYEENLDDQLLDSIFIEFQPLDVLPFRNDSINREDV